MENITLLIRMLIHDLEKPVMAAHWTLDRLDSGRMDPDNPGHRKMIRSSRQAMARAGRMVADMGEILGTRALPVHLSETDISEFASGLADAFEPFAAAEEIRFHFLGEAAGPVTTDPDMVFRVMENFLYNALAHTDPDGAIVLESRQVEDKILLSVFNSGDPIPEGELDRIFEPGTQLLLRQDRRWRGQGLGLSFCRLAASVLGGRVWAENLPMPPGVKFTLELVSNV